MQWLANVSYVDSGALGYRYLSPQKGPGSILSENAKSSMTSPMTVYIMLEKWGEAPSAFCNQIFRN